MSFQDFKLPFSKSRNKKSIFLAANFVKHTGLSSILIYLLNHKNCEKRQTGVSGLEEKCLPINKKYLCRTVKVF